MCTLQSILNDVQRLVYSRGAVVIVRQLAQPCMVYSPTAVYHRIPGDAELAGHAPLHPEKERILRVAPVQARGPTQHPTRESHQRTEIPTARANRNVVDENVGIVIPQTHTLDVTLAALAHRGCRDDTLLTHRQV